MNVGLIGRAAWVSGAGGGIGRAVAEHLASEGVRVVVTDREKPEWITGDTMVAMACDITKSSEIAAVLNVMEQDFGGIDILVNSAGLMHRTDALELDSTTWDRVMDVNLKGTFFASQAAAKSMVARERAGVIINVSSINSEVVFGHSIAYSTSKGGLRTLTRAMAVALGPYGIRVVAVAPGAVADTNLETNRWDNPEVAAALHARTPLGRVGLSQDIAPAIAFAASDAASFMTGNTIFIDGGRMVMA